MRALVAVVIGGLSVVLIIAGLSGSAEQLVTSLFGIKPGQGFKGLGKSIGQVAGDMANPSSGPDAANPGTHDPNATGAGGAPSSGPDASNPGTQRFGVPA